MTQAVAIRAIVVLALTAGRICAAPDTHRAWEFSRDGDAEGWVAVLQLAPLDP